jgi:hypothetical protein
MVTEEDKDMETIQVIIYNNYWLGIEQVSIPGFTVGGNASGLRTVLIGISYSNGGGKADGIGCGDGHGFEPND